jgi:uncharacterized linocin/CFP29 family protein
MTSNPVDQWTTQIWDDINNAVKIEAGKVRIAQKVFPTVTCDNNPTEVADESINLKDLSIQEGKTKPFVEISREFSLSRTQVANEPTLKTCKTLARMAAKQVAMAEDGIIFQGEKYKLEGVEFENLNGEGLIGAAGAENASKEPVCVELVEKTRRKEIKYGEKTFGAVTTGLATLVRDTQAPPYALFLPTKVYADTYAPASSHSLVTTADRIKPLVEGGFYGTGALPKYKGLLVALGGEPTTLYVGREITVEFRREERSKYVFAVVERIQFVARDLRSLVLLTFAEDTEAVNADTLAEQ